MNRRGFGLLEMLIALSLTGIVALMAWSILQTAAFRLRDRSERIGMESSLRIASFAVRSLLEPLGNDSTAGPDLVMAAPDAIVARAVRASGVLCDAAADSLVVRSGAGWWAEFRAPTPGRDSLVVGTIAEPERWAVTALIAAPHSGTCPDGSAALILPVTLASADLSAIGAGSPIRVFEPIELRAYSSAGAQWLGVRSVTSGGSIQPLAGPFSGTGLTLGYFSRGGVSETVAAAVARADVQLTGITERAGGVGVARTSVRSDSSRGAVLLRNAP